MLGGNLPIRDSLTIKVPLDVQRVSTELEIMTRIRFKFVLSRGLKLGLIWRFSRQQEAK